MFGAILDTIALAESFEGATWPNPPVGAVALNTHGEVLALAAHEFAGEPHAEARVIERWRETRNEKNRPSSWPSSWPTIDTLFVTLEPCNHFGKTPPCVDAILEARPRRVIIGSLDPNPKVKGGGSERLRHEGIEVAPLAQYSVDLAKRCDTLLAPFKKWSTSGLPWICLKVVFDAEGSMIPPKGQKTFSSEPALVLSHTLRRRSGALITGSGTVLADWPLFNVRKVPDHVRMPKRWLGVLDRRGRVQTDPRGRAWIETRSQNFQVKTGADLNEMIKFFGTTGVHRVLIEAGPELSAGARPVADEVVEIRVGSDRLTVIKTEPCSRES